MAEGPSLSFTNGTGTLSLDLLNLEKLISVKGKDIKIIAQAAVKYKQIGHYLLNDGDGSVVMCLTEKNNSRPDDTLRDIFGKWLREDSERSWEKLLKCLKFCDLNSLAQDIGDSLRIRNQREEDVDRNIGTSATTPISLSQQAVPKLDGPPTPDPVKALECANIIRIKAKFSDFMMFTLRKLEEKVTAKDFHLWLLNVITINQSDEIKTMFEDITRNNLWNWWDRYVLDEIIEKFLCDNEEVQVKVDEYTEMLRAYKATTTIAKMIRSKHIVLEDEEQPPPTKRMRHDLSYYCILEVKLEKLNPTKIMVEYIDKLWERLRVQFALPPLHVLLDRLEGNSIQITWLFPTKFKHIIMKAASVSEEFFQANQITMMAVDGKCVYPALEKRGDRPKEPSNAKYDPDLPPPLTQVAAVSPQMQVAPILGGYECVFVSPPPENVQTQCAICLVTIRNPYEVSCCGNLFCKTCISREKQENRGCPNCKEHDYDVFHSKSHERCLNQLQVKCGEYTKGCRWMGELGKYDGHQNLTSTELDKRMDGCKYAGLQCRFGCEAVIPRNSILKHEVDECPEKCKSDLSEMEKRLLLKIHDLMQELVQRDNDQKIWQESGSKMDIRRVVSNPEAVTAVGHSERKMKMQRAASDPEDIYTVVPTEYTLRRFTEMRNFKRDYVSEPFYTHPEGYKMCLWVHPNGYGTAENTHVSIFTCFLKGKYDKKLKWPFRGNITVLLLNQARDEDHREHTICYDDSNTTYARRVTTNEKSKGYGVFEAISRESLMDTAYCQYVMDDCLKFRVSKVTMTHKKGLFRSVFPHNM